MNPEDLPSLATSGCWKRRDGGMSVGGFVPIQPAFFGYMALLRGVLLVTTWRWRMADLIPVPVADSKIKPWDFAKGLCGLAWIYW
jgi:hypothetical protein